MLVTIVLLLSSLYLPFVQDWIAGIAVSKTSEATGWEISLQRFRLRFPLKVELDSLYVGDSADTLIFASQARVELSPLHLLRGKLHLSATSLHNGFYRMGTADSALYLKARIDTFSLGATESNLTFSDIDIGPASLSGARVYINILDTVAPPEKPDTAESRPMRILASSVSLTYVDVYMRMLPAIDTLHTFVGSAQLSDFSMNMSTRAIHAALIDISQLNATYLTPSEEFLSTYHSPATKATDSIAAPPSLPWVITADRIALSAPHALYGVSGSTAAGGLDMQRLRLDSVTIGVDSFYNRATDLRVPLRTLHAIAPDAGITLEASGLFTLDSLAMAARGFEIATARSLLSFDASMGLTSPTEKAPIHLEASGFISAADIADAMPLLRPHLQGFSPLSRIDIDADIHGTLADLSFHRLHAAIPSVLTLDASGNVSNITDFASMAGSLNISGTLSDGRPILAALPPNALGPLRVAPFTIKGSVDFKPSLISGDIGVRASSGSMALKALWQRRAEGYDATFKANAFPLQLFMPSLGVADVTASASVKGRGYNPSRRSTSARADILLSSMTYNGQPLRDIRLTASLDTCHLISHLVSGNPGAHLDADLDAWFSPQGYEWQLDADIQDLDLQALHISDTPLGGSMEIFSTGTFNPSTRAISAEAQIDRLHWILDSLPVDAPLIAAAFSTADSLTEANITAGAFTARMLSPAPLDTILTRLTATSVLIDTIVARKSVDVDILQRTLPPLTLTAASAAGDPLAAVAYRLSGITYSGASLSLATDSLIDLSAKISSFQTGATRLDEIAFDAIQKGRFLQYDLRIDNNPGTLDDFAHISLRGFINENKFAARLTQADIHDRQGFVIGFNSTITDSTLNLRLAPYNPIIAYKQWTVNRDNEIAYNFRHRHIDANLKLMSDSSSLHLYTEHTDSTLETQEDIVLAMHNISLADWLSISPFSPPVKGTLGADMRFRWDNDVITGRGNLSLNELYYGRERVGSFDIGLDLDTDPRSGSLRADASLLVDGQKVITARGNLNDSTAVHPFLLDFSMIHFPLRTLNPFIGKDLAQLSGTLNGNMDITGTLAQPVFNGELQFDSTAVKVAFTGASYVFSSEPLKVDSSIVRFNNFYIAGLNGHNLTVDGTVNARKLSDLSLNLALKARDMQIVDSKRARGANLYGRGFIDLDASVRGNMSLILVDADLDILSGTNVTYVLTESQQSLAAPSSTDDMVRFVSFSDTARVNMADSIQPSAFSIVLDADLTISEGSTINVDLSTDGKNKVQINGSGNLSYSMSPSNPDGRLTGRYTINSGFVRYTPQLSTGGYSVAIMSEKDFTFTPGSYVAFNGPVLNPTLSVKAVDRVRANVTQQGQDSRLVNFDIAVAVTGTLENMNVTFDLSTDDDITIENELRGMSPDQRANQAMNMLLYNQYTGPGTKANANLSGNPLYSFLASQLNTWAANNIRGVDISFGVDQYDTTTGGTRSTTTSYSYRVSKTLFNDRFKIVVGGNYSTDADADENFSQNLINDISFEYMLNRSGTMYVRLFRHVGFESILEGEITQTGAGFVLKRKINSLRDLFRFSLPSSTDTSAH